VAAPSLSSRPKQTSRRLTMSFLGH
jgi:hypothetical protein